MNVAYGRVYRILSRNLHIGVCVDVDRMLFLGVREKLGFRYLSTEICWEAKADLGAAPPGLVLAESLGTVDARTRRSVMFDRPITAGGRGWVYDDTDEADQGIRPRDVANKLLFAFLESLP